MDRRHFMTACCGAVAAGCSGAAFGQEIDSEDPLPLCMTPQVTVFDRRRTLQNYKNFSTGVDGGIIFTQGAASLLTYDDFAFALESAIWKRSQTMTPSAAGPWKISVGFFDASNSLKEEILDAASAWVGPGGANLVFVEMPVNQAMIRVLVGSTFNQSKLGNQALVVPSDQPTMELEYLGRRNTDERTRRSIIQHEFGHALGLRHEHQHPASGLTWNVDVIANEHLGTNWARCGLTTGSTADRLAACKESVEQFYLAHSVSLHRMGQYDPTSVMLYTFPARFTREGLSNRTLNLISTTDRSFAGRIYP